MRNLTRRIGLAVAVLGLVVGAAGQAAAGIIIDGTDANDHGFASGGVNFNGWEYMQRALTNLAASTLAANPGAAKVVVDLGTTGTGNPARDAINSAFAGSGLSGSGWSLLHVDGAAAITAWLATLSTSNTGILYLPTYNNSIGDLTFTEMAAINGGAVPIDNFTLAGGSLFSMGESNNGTNTGAYGWLNALIPGLVANNVGTGGIATDMTLTAAGMAAFPGLTNADIANADPWHVHFTGSLGGLQVLATAPDGSFTRNLILGNVGGSITVSSTPEPSTMISAATGVLMLAGYTWRRRRRAAA